MQNSLLIESEKLINQEFNNQIDTTDLFYNLKTLDSGIIYKENGIHNLQIAIHPLMINNIPLDIIFKLIHATKEYPMIKYNPGKKQENIYRFFTNKISRDGRKIPALSKGNIFRLMKILAKSKKVSVYIEFNYDKEIIPIICEFDQVGTIFVNIEFKNLLDIETINSIIFKSINPLINTVKGFLEQSGYKV